MYKLVLQFYFSYYYFHIILFVKIFITLNDLLLNLRKLTVFVNVQEFSDFKKFLKN